MNTIKLYWSYFRNILGTLLLIWPIFLAGWVFHLAMSLGDSGGLLLGLFGAGAVLVFFRSYWRYWAVLFPAIWRWASPIMADLLDGAVRRARAAAWRIRADWNDLRRVLIKK